MVEIETTAVETQAGQGEKEGSGIKRSQSEASQESSRDDRSQPQTEARGKSKKVESLQAVMHYGGKQYVVREGETITLPSQKNFAADSSVVENVLMATGEKTILGTPQIEGATVQLKWDNNVRLEREINFKRRRRKNSSKRTKGVRKYSMRCLVERIDVPAIHKKD